MDNYRVSDEAMKFPYGYGSYISEKEARKNRKEILIAICVYLMSIEGVKNVYTPSSLSFQVNQYCMNRSNNSGRKESLKSPSILLDCILQLKGGSSELPDEETKKLIESLLDKSRLLDKGQQSSNNQISLNKSLKRMFKVIDKVIWTVISSEAFSRIAPLLEKPIKPQLSGAKTERRSSFSSVEGFDTTPLPRRKNVLIQPRKETGLNMARLTKSGLSENHEKLPEHIQSIQRETRRRRAEPIYSSEFLGEFFKYSEKQLEKKGMKHLSQDYGISTKGMTKNQQGLAYKAAIEDLLQRPNLIVSKNATMNHREPATIFFDKNSRLFVSFENNLLYDAHHFITSYKMSIEAGKEFLITNNIGKNRETLKAKIDQDPKFKIAPERIGENEL